MKTEWLLSSSWSVPCRAVVLSLLPLLAGCLVTSSNHERVEGNYVPENTFAQIEPGKTSAAWVKATLGEPNDRTLVDDSASEIWKYNYTERKDSSGAIFLIFGGSSSKERPGTAFVEIADGVVKKKWRG